MAEFKITEDFPKSEIEFDARFSNPQACYKYLFKQIWPEGYISTFWTGIFTWYQGGIRPTLTDFSKQFAYPIH